MTLIFFATWFGQSLNNWRVFNAEQATHDAPPVSWGRYLLDPDFWEKTLQNWQSEFLAVGTMVVFTIYLRQRGSPEIQARRCAARRDGNVRLAVITALISRGDSVARDSHEDSRGHDPIASYRARRGRTRFLAMEGEAARGLSLLDHPNELTA